MSIIYKFWSSYNDMVKEIDMIAPVNDWFHPSGTPCKKIRKGTKNHKKKSKK